MAKEAIGIVCIEVTVAMKGALVAYRARHYVDIVDQIRQHNISMFDLYRGSVRLTDILNVHQPFAYLRTFISC